MTRSSRSEQIVLDLETKKGFAEVEDSRLDLLGVSVAGIYSYRDDQFKVFTEGQLSQLLPYLKRAQLVIGFNIKRFDYPVLQPYLDFDLNALPTLDILQEIAAALGFRLSLDSIAKATLQFGKSGSGLDALRYFRQGDMEKLIEYCRQDVLVTREVYEYGRRNGQLLYFKGPAREAIPVNWAESQTIPQILQEAFKRGKTVEIEYSSPNSNSPETCRRKIDIYAFDFGRVVAFCHLRQDLRTFNQRRILSAKLTENSYQIPPDFKRKDQCR
ncbi:MAG: WYL domain-containing protein [Candidatus Omnitrophica bacterium]|nr:WYL domain-containing protein [Candidatus Omnitrophota bacterium]